jgi:hypothetical protein
VLEIEYRWKFYSSGRTEVHPAVEVVENAGDSARYYIVDLDDNLLNDFGLQSLLLSIWDELHYVGISNH